MDRIQFASTAGGANVYELSINPVRVDAAEILKSVIVRSDPTVDGEAITFTPYFDSRRSKLIWRRMPADDSTVGTIFDTQVGELETMVFPGSASQCDGDGYTYMRFQDIADAFGIYTTYTKIKIISVDKVLSPGGKLVYDTVEVVWEKAET